MIYLNHIDLKVFNFILDKINLDFPFKRKPKYDNKYYLERIIFILKSGCSFRQANCTSVINHYSSIFKKYKSWLNKGFFNNLFDEMINKYKKKLKKKFIKHSHKSSLLTLFIDSTNIRNKNGKQLIGRNYQDKFKNGNKVTIVCDQNKVPLIVTTHRADIHDSKILRLSKTINSSLTNIQTECNLNKILLVGDKGYMLKNKHKQIFLRRNIKLVNPYRKNQKLKNSKSNEKRLKERHKVENLFGTLKQFKRIQLRYDSNIGSYKAFILMACLFIGYRTLFRNT